MERGRRVARQGQDAPQRRPDARRPRDREGRPRDERSTLAGALQQPAPEDEMLLFGTTDGFANIHAPNERVVVDEFEKTVVAEADFFGRFAAEAKAA